MFEEIKGNIRLREGIKGSWRGCQESWCCGDLNSLTYIRG